MSAFLKKVKKMLPGKRNIWMGCVLTLILMTFSGPLFSQISVTSPSSREEIKACPDYADEVLLDRWDMNERTDLGWRIYNTYELPKSYLKNITFANGLFSAISEQTAGWSGDITSDVNITILDSAYPNAVVIGKTGRKYPINADKYTHLVLRMYLQPVVEDMIYGQSYLLWSKNTIYGGQTTSRPFFARDGWHIYFIDIPSLGIISGSDPWNGWIDSLRMDPIATHDKEIKIDWIRLVNNDLSTQRTTRWSGASGNVDVYLDNDNNRSNGNLGTLAKNVSGTSYSFLTGALAAGDYYVALAPAGTNPATSSIYSAGYYHVNDIPIFQITKPNDEGSDVDFATAAFSDPWDMANAADVESTVRVRNASFQSINYEDLVGQSYSNQSVFYGESDPAPQGSIYGDPYAYFLFPWYGKRGTTTSIDTSKYHNLTFKMGIAGTYSYADGSIARVVWKRDDEAVENVCRDIVIKHFPDRWLMNKIVCDLKTIPLEDGAGSPSHSGWTGFVNAFRIDPLEFPDSRGFFFDDVKIAADWTANTSFALDWTLSDSDSPGRVSLYYDSDNTGYDGAPIVTNLSSSGGTGRYTWDTSAVPAGKYWIYAIVTDGVNENRCYSTGPLIVDHDEMPEIALSKNVLYFGGEIGGAATQREKVLITNRGQGALNWQVTKTASWIEVNPTSAIGNGVIEIGVNHSGLSSGARSGVVTISDPRANNSPQRIDVYLTVFSHGADAGPFGFMDTPVNGSNVYGSVPVTGWALDDIEVKKIEIKRAPDVADGPGSIGADGLVYIGDAVFVKGARPDVAAAYPTYPRADSAGWGYMLLTYFLPRSGNGNFRLYAIAEDTSGRRVSLGWKDIVSDNAGSTKPFGTIDTPAQGGLVSGSSYVNFGWALTPLPKEIPRDGSTFNVWVDSLPIGKPVYNQYRQDIYDLFPGYKNRDGAVGYYYLDTTKLTNGVHTIAWSAVDDGGESQGIGSRYFEVQNLGGAIGGMSIVGMYLEDLSGLLKVSVEGKNEIEVEELDYIKVRLKGEGGKKFLGWGEDITKRLPLGSTLEEEKGVFHWRIGPGFLGRHVLHFAVCQGNFISPSVEVVIRIKPKKYDTINQEKYGKIDRARKNKPVSQE
jgi:hypothetical protein